jgi:transcriptional regulator with XRE-family HTH domain
MDDKLYNNSEKLKYVVDLLGLKTKDIAKKLGVQDSFISKLYHDASGKLKPLHLYAFSSAYNIPLIIFNNPTMNSKEKIRTILKDKLETKSIFIEDSKILEELLGEWYLYSYPSNQNQVEVWETKTTFYADGSVVDEHDNRGMLYIGRNQSIILKESACSKNITSITFDNHQVSYKIFPFSRVSKSNGINKELFNFGVFSKYKIDLDEIKEIMGEKSTVQLKMKYDFLERIASRLEI